MQVIAWRTVSEMAYDVSCGRDVNLTQITLVLHKYNQDVSWYTNLMIVPMYVECMYMDYI